VETGVQALLASVDTPMGKVRPCDIHQLSCGLDGIKNEWLRHLPENLWYI
jgi:hypothetical protein